MKDVAFCTVAFGDRYIAQLDRLIKSIIAIYPDADILSWKDSLPPGSKSHEDSLYGFKVHAIQAAIDLGHKKIIWLDPACIMVDKVDYYFEKGMPAVLAVKDDNKLEGLISDKALNYYDNPEIIGLNLVGGSLYVFNFELQACIDTFNHWKQAEADGIFGSQQEAASEQINGHRNDESCMAIALYFNGLVPVNHSVAKYNQSEKCIFIKRHFK